MPEPMDSPIVQALRALTGRNLFPQAPPPSQPVNAPFSPPASSWAEVQADPLKALANLVMGAVDPWGQPKGMNTGSIGGLLGAALPLASLARGTEAGIAARGAGAARGAEEAAPGIRAYHGSPHDFDKFALEKIGTGEGAQAYGHGLYFAENEGVARSYRDALSAQQNLGVGRTRPIGSAMTLQEQRSVEAANRAMKAYAPAGEPPLVFRDYYDYYNKRNDITLLDKAYQSKYSDRLALQVAKLREIQQSNPRAYADIMGNETPESIVSPYRMAYEKAGEAFNRQAGGRMYEVQINANPDHLLDWDKPLEQQPKAAIDLVRQKLKDAGYLRPNDNGPRQLKAALREWKMAHGGMSETPMESVIGGRGLIGGTPEEVANTLKTAGIPGIKYFDGGSRAAGEGSRNYVIFDDSLITILKKYGVALPMIEALRRKAAANNGRLPAGDVHGAIQS